MRAILRRQLLVLLLTLGASLAPVVGSRAQPAPSAIDFLTWNGTYLSHLQAASLLAFSGRFEQPVTVRQYPPGELPATTIQTMPGLDLVTLEPVDARQGCAEGWLRPLPLLSLPPGPDQVSALNDFDTDSLESCAVPLLRWSDLVFAAPSAVQAQSVEDFFDTHRFPGRRVARRTPQGLLELALLADRVVANALYPTLESEAGLRRAFDRIQPLLDQIIWVDHGREVLQLLLSGEAVMGLASTLDWNAAGAANSPLRPLWDGELVHTDMLAIPRDSDQPEQAWALLRYMTDTESQALLAQLGGYAAVRASARHKLSLDLQQRMPGRRGAGARSLDFDGLWWQVNAARAYQGFDALLDSP